MIGIVIRGPDGLLLWRFRSDWAAIADEDDAEVLCLLEEDLRHRAIEIGSEGLLHWMEATLSNAILISDRKPLRTTDPHAELDRLFAEFVSASI